MLAGFDAHGSEHGWLIRAQIIEPSHFVSKRRSAQCWPQSMFEGLRIAWLNFKLNQILFDMAPLKPYTERF